MLKVLATDNLSESGLKILSDQKDISVDVKPPLEAETLKKEINTYNAIIIRSATKLTADVLSHAHNLELIIRAGIGIDNVDVDYATEKGILVANTPHGNSITTAEHTFALITSLARNIPQACNTLKNHTWDKKSFTGIELKGKTLGLIGLGNIGTVVAKIAQGYAMNVITYDPYVSEDFAKSIGAKKVDLDTLFRTSDIISVHCPKKESTQNMVNEAAFEKMKKDALLINCARGGIVDEKALENAIKNKRIKGAALDVFEKEPIEDHPLFDYPNVVVTPHLGASTREAQEGVSIDACLLLVEYAKYNAVSSAINSSLKVKEGSPRKWTFIDLAKKLGRLQGQLLRGVPKRFTLESLGDEPQEIHEFLQLNAAQEFMKGILSQDRINTINVKLLARRRGIDLVDSQVDTVPGEFESTYSNLVRVKVVSEVENGKTQESIVAGTVIGQDNVRVVQINGYDLDFIPTGTSLLIRNQDKPGVIGHVGTLLGKHNVNISRMSVNLQAKGTEALSIFSVDSPVSQVVIDQLTKVDFIKSCVQIHL